MTDKNPTPPDKEKLADISSMLGMGNLLEGVSNLMTKFGELAERGEQLRQSMGDTRENSPIRTTGEFSVRFGGLKPGDSTPQVKPVRTEARANSKNSDTATQATTVPKERVAAFEIFEEDDCLLILSEMPGVHKEDVQWRIEDKVLHLAGSSKTSKFVSQIELPSVFANDQVSIVANNGVIEVRLTIVPNEK